MFKTGLIIGKFYPFHLGHKYLIDTAISQCQKVYVIVCWNKKEHIAAEVRHGWLKNTYPTLDIRLIEDEDYAQNDSKLWANLTKKWLGFVPEAVFTSENYGDTWAKYLKTTHVKVDLKRTKYPVSGTKVRNNPFQYWDYLLPEVRSYFTKKICLVGAESTGKSTLSLDLAKHYKTAWVPEYGRFHWEARLPKEKGFTWSEDDFIKIAKRQNEFEKELSKEANKVLICDTNAFATSIWFERYMNYRSKLINEIGNQNEPDLYILTDVETPFEDDGTRDGKNIRQWMHQLFIEELKRKSVPYIEVAGNRQERLEQATKAIDYMFYGAKKRPQSTLKSE